MSNHLTLLIVDDEPATRTLLGQIFTQMGHNVRHAEDGFSALREIREAMPDVLLSDLNMPGMSGFELLSVVRRRLPEIYVIATSGAYSGDAVPHGIAADAFYEKASNFKTLLNLVGEAASAEALPQRKSGNEVPQWVPPLAGKGPGEACVMLSCPECLRAFTEEFAVAGPLVSETHCRFCRTAIQYAIVEPLDPLTSQPYHPRLVAAQAPAVEA